MIQYQAAWKRGAVIRWRSLTWAEYQRIRRLGTEAEQNAAVYSNCLLLGPEIENVTAGIAAFIGRHQLRDSAFSGSYLPIRNQLEESRRQLADSWLLAARTLVAGVFQYKFEEIEEWTADILMLRAAQAEFVSGRSLEPTNPQEKPPVAPQGKMNPRQAQKQRMQQKRSASTESEQFTFRK